VAKRKFSTTTIALEASITLKYITALTFIETLSLVITSWEGTSIATTRRLTLTILSTIGIRKIKPGPLVAISRPNLNMTPLSYSRRILIALARRITTKKTMKNKIKPSTWLMIIPPEIFL
jgi:hypothetical protein